MKMIFAIFALCLVCFNVRAENLTNNISEFNTWNSVLPNQKRFFKIYSVKVVNSFVVGGFSSGENSAPAPLDPKTAYVFRKEEIEKLNSLLAKFVSPSGDLEQPKVSGPIVTERVIQVKSVSGRNITYGGGKLSVEAEEATQLIENILNEKNRQTLEDARKL